MSFAGKVVVVTGASTGVGEAISILFAKKGAELALVGRHEEILQKVAKQCDISGKKAYIIKAEFTKETDTGSIIPKVIERFGKIDVLVNNASVLLEGTIMDGGVMKTYDTAMQINLGTPVLLTSAAAPYLAKTKGNIINISSVPFYDSLTNGISKAGLDFLTRAASRELGRYGVRVNSINPAVTRTDSLAEMDEDMEL